MDRKILNIIILLFIFCMGIYHIIPARYLIGRLVYYISLYGIITLFLFYLRGVSLEKKYKSFYLIASFYSIGKMIYHLWVSITKYKVQQLNITYDFKILGVDCELIAMVFGSLVFLILILIKLNNKK